MQTSLGHGFSSFAPGQVHRRVDGLLRPQGPCYRQRHRCLSAPLRVPPRRLLTIVHRLIEDQEVCADA
eukprot:331166-Pleurochrysis_carterae.AAC.1